jgi:hypothetical protein
MIFEGIFCKTMFSIREYFVVACKAVYNIIPVKAGILAIELRKPLFLQ